jgi:hypothetical protein
LGDTALRQLAGILRSNMARADAQAVKLHVHRARLFVRKRLSAYFAGGDAA